MKIAGAYVTITTMKKRMGERGSIDPLLLPLVTVSVLFIVAISFGVWAFMSRGDYKNHSDAKAAVAVAANKLVVQAADAKNYAEEAKNPLKTYVGPDAYGSVHISYPKTWSAYIDTNSGTPLDAYFHADYVPSVQSKQAYNLRVQVVAQSYSSAVNSYASLVTKGSVTASAYSLPKVTSVVGTRLSGAIFPSKPTGTGSIVVLPLRDKTLKIWTESNDYLADFNTYVLPNLSFSP